MSQKGTVLIIEETEYLTLIDYYEQECSQERALEVTNFAISTHCKSARLLTTQARLLIDTRNEEMALRQLRRAEALEPSLLEINLLKAEALSKLSHYNEAISLLGDLKEGRTSEKEELSKIFLQESRIYEKLESYEQMFYALKESLYQNPTNQAALKQIWLSVELSRKYNESISLHQDLINQDPYSYLAWFNLGHAYYYLLEYDKAIEAFEFAFLINEKFEFAYRDCAEVCMQLKRYDKALKCYLAVAEHFPPDGDLLIHIGECHKHLGKISQAKIVLYRALAMEPQNEEIYFHLGDCYAQEQGWGSAIYFLKKAIKLEDRREDYYSKLAEIYFFIGEYEKARTMFDKSVTIAPEESSYWIAYISFLLNLGEVSQALEVLEMAQDNAVGAELIYAKAACLFLLEERKTGLENLGEALIEDFSIHHLFFKLAPAFSEDRDVKAIIHYYKFD
ncbi:MAG: CDC27 family protein [Saprospiraceae bacterium]